MTKKNHLLLICSFQILSACATTPQSAVETSVDTDILFVKNQTPNESHQCEDLGVIHYTEKDNPEGAKSCALFTKQAAALIRKAKTKNANLVVANFSKNLKGVFKVHDYPMCRNSAKIFRCPESALAELKKYE